jgi:hypothetical protein
MVYPADPNHSLKPRLQSERKKATAAACRPELSAFPLRLLWRSASKRKTGNANAYIGSWQFIIQENLSAFAASNDYADKA